jgi:hypothetical protein
VATTGADAVVLEELTSKAVVIPLGVVTSTDIVTLLHISFCVAIERVEVDKTQLRNLTRELRFYGEVLDKCSRRGNFVPVRLIVETPYTTID